jgi:uncharacterized membrane protein
MIKNYLKIALRTLWRHKAFSAINILGLAIGLATCLIILLFVAHELSYDRYMKLVVLAWWGMQLWLQDFEYRTDISWWIFGLALFIALLTVSFHALRAAISNPVAALRNE